MPASLPPSTLHLHHKQSNIPYGYLMTKAPVAPVSLSLPCTALPKLCLLHLNDINIVMENLASSSLPASLTSMKTVDSPSITSYISALTGLRQLNMSCISFPTGVLPGPAWREMTRMATALTQLTLLKLFWTGAWMDRWLNMSWPSATVRVCFRVFVGCSMQEAFCPGHVMVVCSLSLYGSC